MYRFIAASAALTFTFAVNAGTAQAEKAVAAATKPAPASASAAPIADPADPAVAQAMEAMQKAGAPGEAHKVLEPLAGSWTYTAQWWMGPDSPPQLMSGTSTNTLIFGGRFLKQEVRAQATKEMPAFDGLGIIGYDNLRKEYQSIWFDNMATGMMVGSGQFDGTSKAVPAQGDFSCPMTGETHRKYRSVWKITDTNHNTYESYFTTPEGVEFKSMEINFIRQSEPCPPATERC